MRQSRSSDWRSFQQQQQHDGQANSYYQQPNQQPRAAPSNATQEVVAFIEAYRANQSSLTTPPNALTLDTVVRAICHHFRVATFEELLGMSALQLPALRQLHIVNQRVWTFVTCFMQSRRVHTLFECQEAFLQHEGLRSFEELKVGNSFLHTEAVQQLYHSPIAVLNITTRDVLNCLRQFEEMLSHDVFRTSSHINLHEFTHFLAQQYQQPSIQAMGVVIDPSGFGVYVGMLRRIANHEMKEIKTLEQQFQREIAEKMFQLTKEKFSDDNRKQALNKLLEQTNACSSQIENQEVVQNRRGGRKNGVQSLSLDILKRVTDVDVYLDNVLRRKAAADATISQKLCKPISAQAIAETDSKLRNQLTRFLVSSQKSKHHSRLRVVTWVICSIIAKTYALLLSDDKLPNYDGVDGETTVSTDKTAESDKEECDCCCVGEDSCSCPCTCKCHMESSDEEGEDSGHQSEATMDEIPTNSGNDAQFPVNPKDTFACRYGKVIPEVDVTLEEVKAEAQRFVSSQESFDSEPRIAKDVLTVLSSFESHLISKFSVKGSTISWAGRRSVLDLLPLLVTETEEGDTDEDSVSRWLRNLICSSRTQSTTCSSQSWSNSFFQEEVLPFVRECCAAITSSFALSSLSSEKQHKWIAHQISVKLGCTRTEKLGLPSIAEMVKVVQHEPDGGEASVINYVAWLDLNGDEGRIKDALTSENATGESMRSFLSEQALEKLRQCPYLVDVSLYMDWQERYAPFCGSLLSFIRAHEMILLDHAPSKNFMFVSCLNGTILRINEKSTPSDLEILLTRAQQQQAVVAASLVAIHLVSMLVTCKGNANFPKQLVQAHLRAYLFAFSADDNYRQRFVLEVLLETPVELTGFVASLLLEVVYHDSESSILTNQDVAGDIWKACRNDTERKALLFMSTRSLLPLWVDQIEKWCSMRENLTVTSVDGDTGSKCNDNEEDIAKTTYSPPTALSYGCDTNDNKILNLLDTLDSQAAVSSFSNDSVDQPSDEEPLSGTSANVDSCRLLIEELRKKQFGVGLKHQGEAVTSVLRIQQQRLERALKRLSDELYSESTHFVLELLQNADDNEYDDAVIPLGDFSLTAENEIVFFNNERGFTPENIQAICDVGASTKATGGSEASIGKKGIGFKSVFKVSDNPQVHSNGFHICFDARSSQHGYGMGYILPYWIDDASQWKQCRGTTFVLPLNRASIDRVDDISQSLLAFEPSVLLFLRRIRELRLRDLSRQHTLHFHKKEMKVRPNTLHLQLLSLEKKNEKIVDRRQQHWLVVKEKLNPPSIFGRIHSTTIELALPVGTQSEKARDRPSLQQVFAYLPLRSYGLRFILQGDFEIPSSREAITNGSEWNEWLLSKFPALLRAAVRSYMSLVDGVTDGTKVIAAISHLISLLPLEHEVQAPFRSIIPEIMRELRQVKWLASCPVEKFHMPSELIDCVELTGNKGGDTMTGLREALSDDVIASTINKRFLHPALSRDMSTAMKSQLRIEQLHSSHLLRVLSLSLDKNDIDWTLMVLTLLAKLWGKDRHAPLLWQELRLIKCFSLQQKGHHSDGSIQWISLAEAHDSLFIPAKAIHSSCEVSYSFYSDLYILDDRFTNAIHERSKLRAFLMNEVGLHVMEDHDLIRHHILPKMATLVSPVDDVNDKSAKEVEIEEVTEYGMFLSSHVVSCRNCPMRADIKMNVAIVATSGRVAVNTSNCFVVLPSTFEKISPLISWITVKAEPLHPEANIGGIVSGDYFSHSEPCGDGSLDRRWHEFLVHACNLPLLFDIGTLTSDPRSQAGMKQLLKWIELEDDIALKRSSSKLLAEYLDELWSRRECGADSASTSDTADWWRQYCWLEGSDGKFHRPIDLYMPVKSITRLFSPTMVTFTAVKWKSDEFSERVLGIRANATVFDVFSVISSLPVDSSMVCSLTIDKMIRMYRFLWEESQRSQVCREDIMKAFSSKMLVFIPAEADRNNNQNYFTNAKNVVWASSTRHENLVSLEAYYPKSLCAFFTEICGIQRKPSLCYLLEMITRQPAFTSYKLCASEQLELWKEKQLPLLCALSKRIKKRSLSKTESKEIKKALRSTAWLPVRSVTGYTLFCSLEDQVILATTEKEKKLRTLVLSLAKKLDAGCDEGIKMKNEEDLKLAFVDALEDNYNLDALLRFTKFASLSAHLKTHASSWCKVFDRFIKSAQLDSRKYRKKLVKIGQLMVKAWASSFSLSSSTNSIHEIQSSVQHLNLFPTIDESAGWASASNLYINDQTELLRQELLEIRKGGHLDVLGLFSCSYFVRDSADEDEVAQIRQFLIEICGMKSLKAHLQYEVSVVSTHRPASEAFHGKIHLAFALAQRYLFHNHLHLYRQLNHGWLRNLVSELQCAVVDGHDGFQVVYRVGNSCSLRRGSSALSRCFLDAPRNTLFIQSVTGDEEASALSFVLMELSRKLFGAQVAASLANLLYLSLLQPSEFMREQWLVEAQRLPPIPVSEAGNMWVEQTSSIAVDVSRKRVAKDVQCIEDIAAEEEQAKEQHDALRKYETKDLFPLSTNYSSNGDYNGIQMQRRLYQPLCADRAPFYPPLGTATNGPKPALQSLSLINMMTKEEREAIGRWGEEYVFNQLKQQHAENGSDLTVEWINEHEESGLPYDLTLSSGNKVVEYIEVKSTRTTEKGVFEISMNELDQAAIHGSSYCIYRVFNAGNAALCRVIRMKNPISLVRQRKIQLALVMQ
ncbi:hypothetical protein PsorP6_008608 [Peronosclerospora sorghi]|uniref:Uncharacterized protein n=1 Tax=Peronosclerospora sorghi TaxID=230839 RepID=A0ACC0WBB4_9STRA|nr:hypothetical protein PsorP6_008608 [Peronosclerospora sorghi]